LIWQSKAVAFLKNWHVSVSSTFEVYSIVIKELLDYLRVHPFIMHAKRGLSDFGDFAYGCEWRGRGGRKMNF